MHGTTSDTHLTQTVSHALEPLRRPGADAALAGELDTILKLAALLLGGHTALILPLQAGAVLHRPSGNVGGAEGPRGAAGVRAAVPLYDDAGGLIGELQVLGDALPAGPDELQRQALHALAGLAARALARDTALKRAERVAEEMFHRNPLPMWIYDPASLAFLDVNEAAVQFYGHSRATLLGMTVLDIRPPEERHRMIAAVREGSDLEASAVWRHCRADGSPIDVITRGRAMTYAGRNAVLAVALDRTELQALRRDLGDTQLLLDGIIEALPVGVFVKDMQDQGRYVIYNSTVSGIVGRPAASILGRLDAEVFGGPEGADFVAQDRRVMAAGRQLVVAEEPVTRPSGETRRIRTVKKPLPTLDGSPPRYLLGISEDVTERRASEDRMAHMASHDSLTDLPNRMAFEQHLSASLVRRGGSGIVTLLCLDLDGFKTINDTYGHPVGDELLKQVAARLRTTLRRADLVARLGGDEFALLTRVAGGAGDALAVADRVLRCFDRPFDLGECKPHVDVSIGIALGQAQGQTAERMMRHADIALYAAKSESRGGAKLYAEAMSTHVEARQLLSEDLRRAVTDQQFELDYQPLHDIGSDRITGFEALVRWRHPVRGRIAPGDFIPVAEQNGLIVDIGAWVLREACRQAARWPSAIKIAVNLSAVQFRKSSLVTTVKRAIEDSGIAPPRLELEITESILLADSGSNLQILHDLRALGVRIAMDDFGTGYSSLSYLRAFPFDKIKIDRSFVADVCSNPGSVAIIRAVTGLGSSLSITTTAEGIETQEQFARLKQEGFDELQGYLIGRPMSDERALALALAQSGPIAQAAE